MSIPSQVRVVKTLYRSFRQAMKRMQAKQVEASVQAALAQQFPSIPPGLVGHIKNEPLTMDMLRTAFRYPVDETTNNSLNERIDAAFSALRIINVALSTEDTNANIHSGENSGLLKSVPSNGYPSHPPKPASVKYSIGQVIAHNKLGYRGVIIGWHPTCQASAEWKARNGTVRPNQAFYSVAVDVRDRTDAQVSYVAQENIRLLSSSSDVEGEDESTDGIPFYVNPVPMNVIDNTDFAGEGNGGIVISAKNLASRQSLASAVACSSAISQGHMENIAALNKMVFHPLVTKYFTHFRSSDGIYIPAPHLAQMYPNDITSPLSDEEAVPWQVRLSVDKQRPNVDSTNCRDDTVAKTFGQIDSSRRPITGHS